MERSTEVRTPLRCLFISSKKALINNANYLAEQAGIRLEYAMRLCLCTQKLGENPFSNDLFPFLKAWAPSQGSWATKFNLQTVFQCHATRGVFPAKPNFCTRLRWCRPVQPWYKEILCTIQVNKAAQERYYACLCRHDPSYHVLDQVLFCLGE